MYILYMGIIYSGIMVSAENVNNTVQINGSQNKF